MPRNYIRKGSRGQWTDKQMQSAIDALKKGGISIPAAARKFGLPVSTLRNHYSGKNNF